MALSSQNVEKQRPEQWGWRHAARLAFPGTFGTVTT